jgi:hypothetical protein
VAGFFAPSDRTAGRTAVRTAGLFAGVDALAAPRMGAGFLLLAAAFFETAFFRAGFAAAFLGAVFFAFFATAVLAPPFLAVFEAPFDRAEPFRAPFADAAEAVLAREAGFLAFFVARAALRVAMSVSVLGRLGAP